MSLLGQIVAGESATPAGQQAVINVIQNRAAVNFGGYGTSLEQQATAFQQFSAYPNALGQSSASTENLVSQAQNGTLGNIVPNSLNYANPSIMSQSSQPNSWVWSAQASGQGVQIGGNTFWANSKGGSPGYDPTQLASGASTQTGGWDGIAPDTTGISGAGSDGVGTAGNGGLGSIGWDSGSYGNPSDITGFSVAGVNAPLDASSGGFANGGASAGGGLTGGGASSAGASAFPGSGSGSGAVTVSGQAGTAGGPDATQTGGGTSTAPQNTPTLNILGALPTAVGTGLAAIGQNINNGISTAVNQATTGLQSVITNATGLFTRGAMMVFGILLVIIALVVIGLHGGGKTVAYATDRMGTGT